MRYHRRPIESLHTNNFISASPSLVKSDRSRLFHHVGGVEAEEDGVEDVQVDQGARLVRVAVGLLRLVL